MTKTKAAPAATAQPEPRRHPHCEAQWPFNQYANQWLARAHYATVAACVMARLLEADQGLQACAEESDNPADEPQPFGGDVVWGLTAALRISLDEADFALTRLANGENA